MKATQTKALLLFAWIILIPLVYLAPGSLLRYQDQAGLVVGFAASAALLALMLHLGTSALQRLEGASKRGAPFLLILAMIVYVAVSFHAFRRNFLSFSSHLPQLGLFAQSVWTTIQGHAFANSHETIDGSLASHFGIHFSPTLLLLVPVYAVLPSPMTLMFVQAMAVAAAAVPLYLVLRMNSSGLEAAILSIGLLLLPALAWAGSNDFHDSTFLPFFFMLAILGFEKRSWKLLLLGIIAVLGVREDAGLSVAVLGIYFGLRGFGWKNAALISGIGIFWYLSSVFLIIPHFSSSRLWVDPAGLFSLHFGRWGDTPLGAVTYIVTHPLEFAREVFTRNRLHYLYSLLQPTLILPMLAGFEWLAGLPILLVNLLSGQPTMRHIVRNYAIVPIFFSYLAVVHTSLRFSRWGSGDRGKAMGLVTAIVVLMGVIPSFFLTPGPPVTLPSPPAGMAREVLAIIPEEAPVYAPVSFYPHLANRTNVGCWESLHENILDFEIRGKFEIIVLWPEGDRKGGMDDKALVEVLEEDTRFERITGFSPFFIFKKIKKAAE